VFASGQTQSAILTLTATTAGLGMAQTAQLLLIRRVEHRRLAILQTLNALGTTAVALSLAWQGVTLWALLATDLVTLVLTLTFLYVWRPVWRPRLAWSSPTVYYYLRFGSRNFLASVLQRALDQVDDLWTGIFLGTTALSYYSRAYTFATYPRRILAAPIDAVASGTYAELKGNRHRLSQAFFRTNAILVRSGFFLAGLLALIAPEFIRLLLGAKWLPMLEAFRLMLIFTLLDPIKMTVGNLFIAVGRPEQILQARTIQLVVLVVGLFALGWTLGIVGVALAMDIMLVVGIATLLWRARQFVSFSPVKLFGAPTVGLLAGLLLTHASVMLGQIQGSDWYTAIVKVIVFPLVYVGVLMLLERRHVRSLLTEARSLFLTPIESKPGQ
jgi:O-antigen/teichoic acid export membrane protein